ncbi:selenide, water dikinase SelD [Sulfitobacter sp. F26169L]|uniref:selenide, water dikinase SelD n=1 Tax=Sulfitobacter sp. F26169L TaxID=2996015 RepID=UPI002260F652|nr:selenide, water dikinase SelD [Sulfitobacter sp. F26169L]MCX7564731.1 selenide, water dikinase SelD [Sulfitobacter sp. F26169L]
MLATIPFTRDLVLVGGGHAHALVLRKWGMNPLPGARLTLINPGPTAPYTGMLPGHIAGHYSRDTLEIDLMRLARFAGARLILDSATAIDRGAKMIHLAGRDPVAYDIASIDLGITARMDIDGFDAHAVGAKPLDIYAAKWRGFLEDVRQGRSAPTVAVIGGGVAGCELAMAMAHALHSADATPDITVIEAGPDISGVGSSARAKLRRAMHDLGITIRTDAQITHILDDKVVLSQQPDVAATLCVGAAGAFPHSWIAQTDLPLHDGFIVIDPDLRVKGDPNLFAVGDCAHMPFAPRPKAGVFAVRAAPVLYHNLRAVLSDATLKPFRPQKSYLKLISLGRKSAMAEKYGGAIAAPLLWRWKDRIDRAFMNKLEDLPVMRPTALPAVVARGVKDDAQSAPLCGGCGAKVGNTVLQQTLGQSSQTRHGDVVTGAGDDAAILRQPGGGFQVLSTDHLRAFIEDPARMTRIAAVHALGDIWAMGAKPQVALSSIILPRMSAPLQQRTLAEINAAARDVFTQAGASVVGGHTTMGAELTIGFTVTGTRQDMPITVAGAQAGDMLVLTRPIGAGVILAAPMAGTAPARVVAAALDTMAQPQHIAAQILGAAHAMTDTTGFGLAGHVQAICDASGLRGEIWRDKVPLYEGARALSDAGVHSSLLAANIADAPTIGIADPLMHDPQTAGGLLAALPPRQAREAIDALQAQGLEGWIIGTLSDGTGPIKIS